jgi:antitoxin (DNA-binding transcriptional repressor) of toxin-antitoxin stability system
MVVTAAEFETDIGKYLSLVGNEDIFITKNGQNVARLSGVVRNKVDIVKSLFGIIPNDGRSLTELREERLARYENTD